MPAVVRAEVSELGATMPILPKRAPAKPVEPLTENKSASVCLACRPEDIVIGYGLEANGTNKRPVPSFNVDGMSKVSSSDSPKLPKRRDVSLSVCCGEEFVNRREDKWGIGTLEIKDDRQTTANLYLDLQTARDFVYMLNDWRRHPGTRLYLEFKLWLDRQFMHAAEGYPVEIFIISSMACCVHGPDQFLSYEQQLADDDPIG
jgi:hypothetical protein